MSPMSPWIANARLVVKILLGRLQIQKLQIDTSHTSHTPHTSHSTSYTELDSLDTVVLDKVFVGFRWILWVTTTETLSQLCANQTWLNTHPTFKNRHGALGCVTHVTHVWWTDGPKVELQTSKMLKILTTHQTGSVWRSELVDTLTVVTRWLRLWRIAPWQIAALSFFLPSIVAEGFATDLHSKLTKLVQSWLFLGHLRVNITHWDLLTSELDGRTKDSMSHINFYSLLVALLAPLLQMVQ